MEFRVSLAHSSWYILRFSVSNISLKCCNGERDKKCPIKHLLVQISIFVLCRQIRRADWLLLGEEYCFGSNCDIRQDKMALSLKIWHWDTAGPGRSKYLDCWGYRKYAAWVYKLLVCQVWDVFSRQFVSGLDGSGESCNRSRMRLLSHSFRRISLISVSVWWRICQYCRLTPDLHC